MARWCGGFGSTCEANSSTQRRIFRQPEQSMLCASSVQHDMIRWGRSRGLVGGSSARKVLSSNWIFPNEGVGRGSGVAAG